MSEETDESTAITNLVTSTVPGTSTGTTVYDVAKNPLAARNVLPQPSQDIQSLNGSVLTTLGYTMYVLRRFPSASCSPHAELALRLTHSSCTTRLIWSNGQLSHRKMAILPVLLLRQDITMLIFGTPLLAPQIPSQILIRIRQNTGPPL